MASKAGHVKTCENCARGKIRCIRAPESPICDRRVEALEAKVDELLARVGNQPHVTPQREVSDLPSAELDPHSNQDKPQDVIDRGVVSYGDAVKILDSFRDTLMPYFPFVLIPPETTLDQLRAEKPFLLLAVLKVCTYKNEPVQKVLEETFQSAVADRMIFSHSPSMDVLQGLLVALAWIHHQAQHLRFSSYLHLAWSVAGDLRLDRVSETQSFYSRMDLSKISPDHDSSKQSKNEGRRALVGCYMLSSCRSTLFQKDRMMTRLSYVEKSAFELLANAETASDRCLIHLVKLQQIFERIDDAVVTSASPVLEADMNGFQSEINEYKTTLPATFSENSLLQFNLHTLQLFLCQACLFDKHDTASLAASAMPRSNADAGLPPHLRSGGQSLDLTPFQVELLTRGLTGAKKFFDYFFKYSPETYGTISHTQWLQTGFNLVLSCKLAVTGAKYAPRSPHVGALCSALDMPQILRGTSLRLQWLSKDRVKSDEKSQFKHFYELWVARILEWFEQKYHLTHSEDKAPPPAEVAYGEASSSGLRYSSSLQDTTLMGGSYGVVQGNQSDMPGSWPDFLWDISTEDILGGYMGLLDMPESTLQHGYEMQLP
ncbi:hypothetical protein MYU51_016113 [Penicillium brevicompactum]|uniref:uncharacterized protein n=1 Tax=Penicillium brevicompactum TaxID=5074 RepID=UPI00253FF9DC|nr:uncharacterized protein N7506_002815 [Penicillium brevicompactum]KAJ5342991.1 hypothetical protein N7506_002815 [Penicillium brevicompactum]